MTPGDRPPRHPMSQSQHLRAWDNEQGRSDTTSKRERELHDRRQKERFLHYMQILASGWSKK